MSGPLVVRRALAVAAFVLAVALPLLSAQQAGGKRYALLVGINAYDKRGFIDLRYAERDVTELARLLKSDYDVTLLLGSSPRADDRPTKANIEKRLDAILEKTTKKDLVLVAFAGHGTQLEVDKKERPFFCPVDAVKSRVASLVGLSDVLARLNDSGGGRNLLLVDACRDDSSEGRSSRGIDGNRAEGLPEGTAILFSCSKGQRAYETEKAGGGHGVFFHYVLEGLRGKAARAGSRDVTWDRLATYVQEQVEADFDRLVPESERRPNDQQHPHEVKNIVGRAPLLLTAAAAATDSAPAPRPIKTDDGNGGKEILVDLGGGVKMEFVRIQGDTFEMGDLHDGDEDAPRHKVEISTFYLGKTEVTQEQYQALTGENPSYYSANGGGKDSVKGLDTSKFPVETVRWTEAKAYCDKMTEKFGRGGRKFRLPTEAQWEFACRAGTKTRFHSGDEVESLKDYAWYSGNADFKTHKVGEKKANASGLYDMHGNVWEWCADWYDEDYYAKSYKKDLENTSESRARVLRGGSFGSSAHCRAACRSADDSGRRVEHAGFRVALRLD